jgi:hypothetical protein
MKNEFLVFGIVALVVLSTMGLTLAAPEKSNNPNLMNQSDLGNEPGVGIWTGNGGFISWLSETVENQTIESHNICKGTERLPEKAIEKMLEHGWWLSEQGPEGAETICKQSGLGNGEDEPEPEE